MNNECKLCILMGKITGTAATAAASSSSSVSSHRQQSMILVPMDAAGVKVLRNLSVFGFDDAPRESIYCNQSINQFI